MYLVSLLIPISILSAAGTAVGEQVLIARGSHTGSLCARDLLDTGLVQRRDIEYGLDLDKRGGCVGKPYYGQEARREARRQSSTGQDKLPSRKSFLQKVSSARLTSSKSQAAGGQGHEGTEMSLLSEPNARPAGTFPDTVRPESPGNRAQSDDHHHPFEPRQGTLTKRGGCFSKSCSQADTSESRRDSSALPSLGHRVKKTSSMLRLNVPPRPRLYSQERVSLHPLNVPLESPTAETAAISRSHSPSPGK